MPHLDLTHLDGVVRLDDEHPVHRLQFADRPLRQQQRALDLVGIEADAREHARTQQALGVGKLGLDGQRAGGGVDVAVDLGRHPALLVKAAVGEDQRQRTLVRGRDAAIGGSAPLLLVGQPPRGIEVATLGDRHPHRDGIGARDHVEKTAIGALADEVAHLGLGQADQAALGRVDAGVAQLDLRQLDLGVGRIHVAFRRLVVGHRGIQIQLADRVHRGQRTDAIQIRFGLDQAGARLRQHRPGLGELGLERLRVDGVEQRALVDEGAFLEMDAIEKAVDPGAYGHVGGADGLADQIQRNAHVTRGDGDEWHLQHGRRRRRLAVAATEQRLHQSESHAEKQE
ncbi:hypothetical protein D9M71_352850 [compost metagenome]